MRYAKNQSLHSMGFDGFWSPAGTFIGNRHRYHQIFTQTGKDMKKGSAAL